ncbi:MAG: rhodanese-like domain-containing protein [Sandaracinaceae bacterium]
MRRPLLALTLFSIAACSPRSQAPEPAPGCDPDDPSLADLVFERSPGGAPEVTADWLRSHACAVRVIDVREDDEVARVRLPFGEHVPAERIADDAGAWDPHAPVVLVDRSGRRSARLARRLEDRGLARVASLTGGILLWVEAGFPVVEGARGAPGEAGPAPAAGGPPSGPVDRAAIEAHLGAPTGIRWVKAASILMQGTEACVDGRTRSAVIGTPGGDAGELLLALAALEATRGEALGELEVAEILDAYIEAFGRFYLHADEHALQSLRDDPRFAPAVEARGVAALVRHPPRALEGELLTALSEPEHVGCGHLRLTLLHPEEYGVRPALTSALLRTVLRRLWQGGPIDFVVLEGVHQEGAVVNVRLDRPVYAFSRIPMVVPHAGGRELFVNHPEVSAWLREQNVAFLFEVDPWLRAHPEAREAFLARVEGLGARQLAATLAHLAARLPVFEAHVGEHGIRVEGPLR